MSHSTRARFRPQRHRRTFGLQSELARSRNLLRALFDGLDDGLALLDHTGRILAINRPLAAVLAREPNALVGQRWTAACAAIVPPFPAAWVSESLSDGCGRYDHARHAARSFDIETIPLLNNRRAEQLIVRVVDVTDRLHAEAQLVEQERFAASGRLAMIVAHEVNTPLQSIESCLHLATRADTSSTSYLRLAREATQRVGHILHQLAELYHPAAQQTRTLALNELLERILLLMSGTLARRGIALARELAPALPPLTLRGDDLTQMATSLILATADALPSGGTLTVRSAAAPQAVVLTVEASGAQFDRALLEDCFTGLPSPRTITTAHGIAIVRRIAACLGGTLTVATAAGMGGFTLTLPVNEPTQTAAYDHVKNF
jgi:nitrogen-specific signal transduction histidine kinase